MNEFVERLEWLGRVPWRPIGWSAVIVLLLLPLVAMQFTEEVNWTAGDFVAAAILLGGTGLLIEWAVRQSGHIAYRLGAAGALLTALVLLWINLAVGIIGSEDNPANGWYLVVYIVGLLGAAFSRLRAAGMAVTVAGMALTQGVITVVAVMSDAGGPLAPAVELIVLNGFFIVLWLVSAGLFSLAARREAGVNIHSDGPGSDS